MLFIAIAALIAFNTVAQTEGCTDPASNYDPLVTNDDGSCLIGGVNESLCQTADFNDDGYVGNGDLLDSLSVCGEFCVD